MSVGSISIKERRRPSVRVHSYLDSPIYSQIDLGLSRRAGGTPIGTLHSSVFHPLPGVGVLS